MNIPSDNGSRGRLGLLRVNTEILRELLRFPDGIRITHAVQDWTDLERGSVSFCLAGDGLPDVPKLTPIPEVQAVYHGDSAKAAEFVEFQVYRDAKWVPIA